MPEHGDDGVPEDGEVPEDAISPADEAAEQGGRWSDTDVDDDIMDALDYGEAAGADPGNLQMIYHMIGRQAEAGDLEEQLEEQGLWKPLLWNPLVVMGIGAVLVTASLVSLSRTDDGAGVGGEPEAVAGEPVESEEPAESAIDVSSDDVVEAVVPLTDLLEFARTYDVADRDVIVSTLAYSQLYRDAPTMPPSDIELAEVRDAYALRSGWTPWPGPTVHSSDEVEPAEAAKPETRMTSAGDVTLDPGDDGGAWAQQAFGNTVFPCGHGEVAFTVCPFEPGPSASGRHLVFYASFAADIPLDPGPDDLYSYGFVFDADDDASNNYVPHPSFPNDFFLGTDLWYTVEWGGSAWRLAVTSARSGVIDVVASNARAIILGDTIALVVPEGEFEVLFPPYRITSFWHRGDFGMNPPHEWSGHVQPPVTEPLVTPDGGVIELP